LKILIRTPLSQITFTGFCIILVNFFTLIYFSPNLDVACPPWAYLTYAAGVFLYQLMDNLDGRQARKTKSSSALGELFDHGMQTTALDLPSI
jgi:ethanolaminephosphotransferase